MRDKANHLINVSYRKKRKSGKKTSHAAMEANFSVHHKSSLSPTESHNDGVVSLCSIISWYFAQGTLWPLKFEEEGKFQPLKDF